MRKQKVNDSPSARMQRGGGPRTLDGGTLFVPPPSRSRRCRRGYWRRGPRPILLGGTGRWPIRRRLGGRGREQQRRRQRRRGGQGTCGKRLRLYDSLASYHTAFLDLITEKYRLEESEVVARIKSSASDPFSLERRGHALFDVHPLRRGASSATRCTAWRSRATQ